MQRSSIYTSAAFHALIILIAILGLPFLRHKEFVIPQPITVDLIDISKVTQTDRISPPTPPQPKPPEPPKPPKPQPAPANPSPQPVEPVKEPPKPETRPVKPTPQVDENALPEKTQKKVVKKEEPKKPQPQRDFSSVLKNLDVSKETPPPPQPGQNAPLGEKLTMSEMDALRSQLEQCWDVPIGAKDVEDMTVDIFMVINPDRTLREARIVDTARYSSDTAFMALADSALRAVQRCSPFEVPPDKYNTWNTTTVTFNPKDMM